MLCVSHTHNHHNHHKSSFLAMQPKAQFPTYSFVFQHCYQSFWRWRCYSYAGFTLDAEAPCDNLVACNRFSVSSIWFASHERSCTGSWSNTNVKKINKQKENLFSLFNVALTVIHGWPTVGGDVLRCAYVVMCEQGFFAVKNKIHRMTNGSYLCTL